MRGDDVKRIRIALEQEVRFTPLSQFYLIYSCAAGEEYVYVGVEDMLQQFADFLGDFRGGEAFELSVPFYTALYPNAN